MNQESKPQVKIVKRYASRKSSVFYVLISNVYNDDHSIVLKVFPNFDISKSSIAKRIN